MRLRVTKRAATQIEKALDYIEEDSPQGANHVRARIQTLSFYWNNTLMRAKRPTTFRACGVSRSALIPICFYRVTDGEVIVQRMRHTSRRSHAASRTP